jgi:hypothetical protein
LFAFSIIRLKAQSFEFSLQAGSGVSHFSGSSSASNSTIAGAVGGSDNYTIDPYGSRIAFAYNAGLQGQYVFQSRFIVGLQADYQLLQSKVKIDSTYRTDIILFAPGPYDTGDGYVAGSATGKTILRATYIDLSPYIGYRVLEGTIKFDVLPGMDIGFGLGSHESGKAAINYSSGNVVIDADKNLGIPKTDLGIKLGLAAYYKRYGLIAGYSYGLSNYLPGTETSLHTELFRLGISYRIN